MSQATDYRSARRVNYEGSVQRVATDVLYKPNKARSPEELNMGKPWTENDLTYFTIKGLQEFLKQRGFNHYTRPQLQQRLRDLNGGQNCHGKYRLKDEETGKWSNIRVWWVPEFHEEEIELPIKEDDESDIPFKDDELLTLTDIVEWIKVSESTIYRWMDEGIFPRPLKLGAESKQSPMRWIRKLMTVGHWIKDKTKDKVMSDKY